MPFLVSLILLLFALCGCSVPRVIVLHEPLDAKQHNDLGVSYQHRGEQDLAAREYSRAAELERDWARPLINLGNVRAALGEWEGAEESYRRALERDPENPEIMNNLAWALLMLGETSAALEWASRAVAESPEHPLYLDTLAEIQIRRDDYPAARESLRRALDSTPSPELRKSLEQKEALLDSAAP